MGTPKLNLVGIVDQTVMNMLLITNL